MNQAGWNRREFIGAAALLGIVLGTPGCVSVAALAPEEAPSDPQLAMLREVAQIVIPATDTPGAGDAGAGAFVALALAHGLDGSRASVDPSIAPPHLLRPDGSLRYIAWLGEQLGDGWLEQTAERRFAALDRLDQAAFLPTGAANPWRKLKALILTGYYTSQAGGAEELQYAAIPGRFDPAVPVTAETRSLSNDWTGVEFG